MDVSGQVHAPAAIPRWRDPPRTHWIGGWMGPRAGLNTVVGHHKTIKKCYKNSAVR